MNGAGILGYVQSQIMLNSITGYSLLALLGSEGHSKWYASPEWWLAIIAVPTLVGIFFQAKATADAARATERLVEDGRLVSKRELRAYLTVIIGQATYQERRKPEDGGDLRFEACPVVVNKGQTPARKIKVKTRAAIFPVPLPRETHLPEGYDEDTGESILGPGQDAILFGIVDGFCQDAEVQSIKRNGGVRGLYVWGLITYEDVFGDSHYTRFCQQIYWDLKGNVRGLYIPTRNDAD